MNKQNEQSVNSTGLTKREYFAAHCPIKFMDYVNVVSMEGLLTELYDDLMSGYANIRYQYADAMVEAGKLQKIKKRVDDN